MVSRVEFGEIERRRVLEQRGERVRDAQRRRRIGVRFDDCPQIKLISILPCASRERGGLLAWSWNCTKNSARNPADRTTTNGGPPSSPSPHNRSASLCTVFPSRLCATTSVNSLTHPGLALSTSSKPSATAAPSTPSFSSPSSRTASAARFFPMLEGPSRKKLLPASAGATGAGSRTVKWPMPGRTRFLRMEVDVAEAERRRMREDSRAAWPVAAQSLPCGVLCH